MSFIVKNGKVRCILLLHERVVFSFFLWNLYQGRCVYFYVVAWKIGRWCLWLIFISCMEWFFMVLLFGRGMCRKCHWRENEEKWCSEIVLEEEWKLCDFGSVCGWVGEEHNWEKEEVNRSLGLCSRDLWCYILSWWKDNISDYCSNVMKYGWRWNLEGGLFT